MKSIFLVISILLNFQVLAQTTGTNTAIHQQEEVQKQIESNRNEINNAATTPNSPSKPTKVDTSSWGLDSTTRFEITNHLFGASMIKEKDQTLKGVKLTGMLNIAYYSAELKSKTGKKQGRFVFGFEFPTYDITNRLELFTGIGGTLGDRKGVYADVGVDFILTSWFKIQAGINWNSDYGSLAPQISAGFVW